jgi:inner membrane protein
MEWSTHGLTGVVVGYSVTGDWKIALASGVFALVPDLDEPKSKFGRLFFIISIPINSLFGHRTFTHSLLFAGLLWFILNLFDSWLALPALIGVLSHIAGDLITGRVKLLYPLQNSIGVPIPPSQFVIIDRIVRYGLIFALILIVPNQIFS